MEVGNGLGAVSAGWYGDPTGRHQYRYWDGTLWRDDVANDGQASVDRLARTEVDSAALAVAEEQWQVAADMGSVAVEPLIHALQSNEHSTARRDAARALGEIGDPRAVDALIGALHFFEFPNGAREAAPSVVESAVIAMGQIGDPRAVGPLADVARNGQSDFLGWSVGQAVDAIRTILASHGSEVSVDDLRDVVSLENVFKQPQYFDPDGFGHERKELRNNVDCSDIRGIARRELARRGL
ncbi:MAG: HEAT repeat domain-containing protein [Candidatus Nanopelagicales bacterium]